MRADSKSMQLAETNAGETAGRHERPPSVVRRSRAPAPLRASTAVVAEAGASAAELAITGAFSGRKVAPPSVERQAPESNPVGQTAQTTPPAVGSSRPPRSA